MKPTDPLSLAISILEDTKVEVLKPKFPVFAAETCVGRLQDLDSLIKQLSGQRDTLQVYLDTAIADLKDKKGKPIQDLNEKINALQERYDVLQLQLQEWADENREKFPQEKKSLDCLYGSFGFRLPSSPKVTFLKNWTEKKVLDGLAKLAEFKKKYIERKPHLKKTALIADFKTGKLTNETAKKFGVKIEQEENFFVELAEVTPATKPA